MTPLTVADLAERIESLQEEVATVIRLLQAAPAKAFAAAVEPVAIPATQVARMLSVNRIEVYRLHKDGTLNGFRPHPRAHLKFLVSEVLDVAERMRRERRNA